MARTVQIGAHTIGEGHPVYFIAEIGINHNGSMETAKKLIEGSASAGAQAVKFQKRTVDVVYTQEELARPRENPFGTTNGDLKRGLEFGRDAYKEIDAFAKAHNLAWFASAWDEASVDFLEEFKPPCYKIASASLTDDGLLRHHRKAAPGRPIILSTGMSTLEQVDHAVEVLGTDNLVILHCTSTYPSALNELNLRCIPVLEARYGVPVGYSGHETGLAPSVAAAALGAKVIERHITLDRAMWGSDQAASVEVVGFQRLVKDVRAVEASLGDGKKKLYDTEVPIQKKLRRVG